ncbi:hypothetical protein [Tenacibaculum ovolyticum]|uniref:hypothetical protein n=1 Tax=Tenacibaculum ovolyticum TaxID=104270 RepID=UPI003BA899FE
MALEINIGEEYKIKIEKEAEFENSIFKEVYTQAAKNVEEIVLQAKTSNKSNENNKSIGNNDYNNVIAFTGERGTGKSSSMISFADALTENNYEEEFWKKTPDIKDIKIGALDVIDPSLFRNEDKLFEIIISKMFSEFQKKLKVKAEDIKQDRKRDLIKKFQEVFNNLKVLHNGKSQVYEKEAIEALSDLAFGTNLKDNFKKLVDEYLLCLYDIDKNKNGFLLIAIDDFDLNISGAYEMLEDIRQFLIQSNVIILIACKIEQLQDSIEKKIRSEYKIMIPKHGSSYLNDNPTDMAAKYLLKLIPINKRSYLPQLDFRTELIKLFKDGKELPKNDNAIEEWVLNEIHLKTGFIFIKKDSNLNYLIPKNLREFIQFYKFIIELTNDKIANQESFKMYFHKVWCINNLKKNQLNILNELVSTDNGNKNKTLILSLKNHYSDIESSHVYDNEIKDILKSENNALNISIGDVLTIIINYSKSKNSLYDDLFFYAIKSYYTIHLTMLFEKKLFSEAETIIGSNIYSINLNIINNIIENDFWSFGVEELFEISNIERNKINELVSKFIITSEKNPSRSSFDVIYKKPLHRDNEVVFSILGFIRNIIFHKNHYKKTFGEERVPSVNYERNIIPLFSIDVLEKIINDLIFNRLKIKYSDNYSNILFEHILKKIETSLENLNPDFSENFNKNSFISNIRGDLKSGITEKINSLKKLTDTQIENEVNQKVNLIFNVYKKQTERNDIKKISEKNIKYYKPRYFSKKEITSQGAKQAMNNLVKEYKDYSLVQEEFQYYRNLMENDLDKGLVGIEKLLKGIINNG